MQNILKDLKGNEEDSSTSAESPKPLEIVISHGTTHAQKCNCAELNDLTITAIHRPWLATWRDGVHRCNGRTPPPQVHLATTQRYPGHAQQAQSGDTHPPGTQDNRMSKRPHETKMSYALESYMNQSVKEEPWNNMLGFYTRGGNGDVGGNGK